MAKGRAKFPQRSSDVEIRVGSRSFTFPVYLRKLAATGTEISYFWMDLRALAPGGALVRSIIDLWWEATRAEELADDPEYQDIRVMAEVYNLTGRRTAAKFLDDLLPSSVYSLPSEQVQSIVASVSGTTPAIVDVEAALAELCFTPPVMSNYDEVLERGVLTYGRAAVKSGDPEHMKQFLAGVERGLLREGKHRNRGQRDLDVKCFLTLMAQEAKGAFFQCYAEVWNHLTAALKIQKGLNDPSLLMLRLWHMTQSGLEQIGGEYIKTGIDFRGHVLALHPLSRYMIEVDQLWKMVAEYLVSPSDPRRKHKLQTAMLAAIRIYQATRRENKLHATSTAPVTVAANEVTTQLEPLAEWVVKERSVCIGCGGGDLSITGLDPPEGQGSPKVRYRCADCGIEEKVDLTAEDLTAFMEREQEDPPGA